MSSVQIKEVLPKQGQLYQEDLPSMDLCKPKLMPLKSVTLEKLEKMQREAEEELKDQETAARLQEMDFGQRVSPATTALGAGLAKEADRLTL